MSSSQRTSEGPLPQMLAHFERLVILWAENPTKSERKLLAELNVSIRLVVFCVLHLIIFPYMQHDVCQDLLNVNPKPPQYSPYLRKVLQILKLPIRHSKPIPWEDIRSLRSLSILKDEHMKNPPAPIN